MLQIKNDFFTQTFIDLLSEFFFRQGLNDNYTIHITQVNQKKKLKFYCVHQAFNMRKLIGLNNSPLL